MRRKLKNPLLLKHLAFILIAFTLITACVNAPTTLEETDMMSGVTANITPDPTRAAIVGRVISLSTGEPLANKGVRLAQVFWNEDRSDGAFVLEGARSPGTETDDHGFFVFESLEPADYVIVVGEVLGYHVIVSESDGKPRIYTADPGKILEIEPLKVDLE